MTAITGSKNALYCYDAEGNMTAEHAGSAGNALRRSVTWSAFGMPTTMVSLETNTSVDVAYGPDRQRYKRVDTTVGNANSATTTF